MTDYILNKCNLVIPHFKLVFKQFTFRILPKLNLVFKVKRQPCWPRSIHSKFEFFCEVWRLPKHIRQINSSSHCRWENWHIEKLSDCPMMESSGRQHVFGVPAPYTAFTWTLVLSVWCGLRPHLILNQCALSWVTLWTHVFCVYSWMLLLEHFVYCYIINWKKHSVGCGIALWPKDHQRSHKLFNDGVYLVNHTKIV